LATWRVEGVSGSSFQLAMARGAQPLALVDPAARQLGAGVVLGEDAVEDLLAVLVEAVVAQAAGQVERVVDR
jgi:hypothetical protein